MELWIRSQDKSRFVKAHNFSYDYEVNKHIVNCNGYPYGVYNSKERCLEIIDEIQSLFCDFILATNVDMADALNLKKYGVQGINYYNPHISPKIEYYERSSIVYEMPKE